MWGKSPGGEISAPHHRGGAFEMPKSELFDLAARIKVETPKAYLLDDGTVEAWVPKSQTEDNQDGTFTLPLWLAQDKGFV